MKKLIAILFFVCITSAHADVYNGIGLSAGVGTLGAGITADMPLGDDFLIKLNGNTLNGTYNDNNIGIQSLGLIGGYRLFNNFSIEAGLYYLYGSSTPNLISNQLNNSKTVTKDIQLHNFAPYAGLGYISNRGSGLYFSGNAGILYATDVSQVTSGNNAPSFNNSGGGNGRISPQMIRPENVNSSNTGLVTQLYPVVSFNIGYRF